MTGEQIAELRETAAQAARGSGMAGVDRYCAVIGHEELTRLLDERKRLLDTLRDAAQAFATTHRCSTHLDVARAAIDFVEKPLEIDPVHQL